MDQRRLQYLLAIARAGSFSRAAEDLHMTQPPLSAAIAQLEVDLNARLFTRSSRGVTLTEAGEEAVLYAERAAAQEQELRRRVSAIQTGRLGKLSVGCNPVLAGKIIPRLLRALLSGNVELDISLHEAHPRSILNMVHGNEVDIGVIATASVDDVRVLYDETLRIDFLGFQEMLAFLPPEFEGLPEPLSLRDIAHFEFVSPMNSMRHGIRFSLFDAFDKEGLPRPRVREVPSMQEAVPLITAGLAVGIMPEAVQDLIHPRRVTVRHLTNGPEEFQLSVVSKKDRALEPAIARCRETAFAAIRDGSAFEIDLALNTNDSHE